MKLYRVRVGAGYSWYGTKADAKVASKTLGPWEPHDVPVDKQGLIDWLNASDPPPTEESDLTTVKNDPEPAPLPPPARPPVMTLTEVEEFVQDAPASAVARVADSVCWRIHELSKQLNT